MLPGPWPPGPLASVTRECRGGLAGTLPDDMTFAPAAAEKGPVGRSGGRTGRGAKAPLRGRLVPVLVVTCYLGLALAAYWPLWPGDPSRLPVCSCADPVQATWFLGWIPYALGHLHNPFFTTLIDHPSGVNLAQNTEMPLLGLLTAPLSVAVSPVSSFNLVMFLAYPVSAASMYLVVRRFVATELPAALAGLLYGFSAYVVGQGYGHPNLSFVPLPPVILLLLFELLVAQRKAPLRQGLLLGTAVAGQFLISPEVLATTAIVAALAVAVLAAARPRACTRARLAHTACGLMAAGLLAAVVLAYPVWFLVAGPGRFHGAVQGAGNPYRADLLGPVVPTPGELLAPASLKAVGFRFTGATFPENGSYIGVVLLAACALLVARFRKSRWLVFLAVMALVSFVLSLGPGLVVDGHTTPVPLPFGLLVRLPLLENVLPSRFSLYQDAFVALVAGIGLDELLRSRRARRRQAAGVAATRRWALGNAGLAVSGVGALALLLPAWPLATTPTGVPALFATASRAIPTGGVVLTYPFPVAPEDQAMLWQAVDGYRFSLLGGYALVPNAGGTVSPWPPELEPVSVQAALGYEAMGPNGYLLATAPDLGRALVADTRRYLMAHHVGTVVVDTSLGNHPERVVGLFRRAIGPGRRVGNVVLWQRVAGLLRRVPASR